MDNPGKRHFEADLTTGDIRVYEPQYIKVSYRKVAADTNPIMPQPLTETINGYQSGDFNDIWGTQHEDLETPPPLAGGATQLPVPATNGELVQDRTPNFEPMHTVGAAAPVQVHPVPLAPTTNNPAALISAPAQRVKDQMLDQQKIDLAGQQQSDAAKAARITQQKQIGGGSEQNPAYTQAQERIQTKLQLKHAHPLHQARHRAEEHDFFETPHRHPAYQACLGCVDHDMESRHPDDLIHQPESRDVRKHPYQPAEDLPPGARLAYHDVRDDFGRFAPSGTHRREEMKSKPGQFRQAEQQLGKTEALAWDRLRREHPEVHIGPDESYADHYRRLKQADRKKNPRKRQHNKIIHHVGGLISLAQFIELYRTGALSDEELENIRRQNEEARRWLDEEAERAGSGYHHEQEFYRQNPGARNFEQQTYYENPEIREHPEAQTAAGRTQPHQPLPESDQEYSHVFSIPQIYNHDVPIELHINHEGWENTDRLGMRPHYRFQWVHNGTPVHRGEAWGPVVGRPDMHDMARSIANFASYDADRIDDVDPDDPNDDDRDLLEHVGTPYHEFLQREGERLSMAGMERDPEHPDYDPGPQLIREQHVASLQKQRYASGVVDNPLDPYAYRHPRPEDWDDTVDLDNPQTGDDTFRSEPGLDEAPDRGLMDKVFGPSTGDESPEHEQSARAHENFFDLLRTMPSSRRDLRAEDLPEDLVDRTEAEDVAGGVNDMMDRAVGTRDKAGPDGLSQAQKDHVTKYVKGLKSAHKQKVQALLDDWLARGGTKTGEPRPVERFSARYGLQQIVPMEGDPFPQMQHPVYPVGKCEGCGTKLYDGKDISGDPRGPLGEHTRGSIDAAEYEVSDQPGRPEGDDRRLHGPSALICPMCDEDQERHNRVADKYLGHKAGDKTGGYHWTWQRQPDGSRKNVLVDHTYPDDREGIWHAPGEQAGNCYECDHGVTGFYQRHEPQG